MLLPLMLLQLMLLALMFLQLMLLPLTLLEPMMLQLFQKKHLENGTNGLGGITEESAGSACVAGQMNISVKECASTLSAVWLPRSILRKSWGSDC